MADINEIELLNCVRNVSPGPPHEGVDWDLYSRGGPASRGKDARPRYQPPVFNSERIASSYNSEDSENRVPFVFPNLTMVSGDTIIHDYFKTQAREFEESTEEEIPGELEQLEDLEDLEQETDEEVEWEEEEEDNVKEEPRFSSEEGQEEERVVLPQAEAKDQHDVAPNHFCNSFFFIVIVLIIVSH